MFCKKYQWAYRVGTPKRGGYAGEINSRVKSQNYGAFGENMGGRAQKNVMESPRRGAAARGNPRSFAKTGDQDSGIRSFCPGLIRLPCSWLLALILTIGMP